MNYIQCSKCGKIMDYNSPLVNSVWITNETLIYFCNSCVEKAKDLNTSEVKE